MVPQFSGAEALLDGSRQGRSRRGVRSIGLWQVDADQMRQWARAVLGRHHHARPSCPVARLPGLSVAPATCSLSQWRKCVASIAERAFVASGATTLAMMDVTVGVGRQRTFDWDRDRRTATEIATGDLALSSEFDTISRDETRRPSARRVFVS
jgi:hypothetical protein